MTESPYWFLTLFVFVAFGFAIIPLCIARLWAITFSPQKSGLDKNATYECGLQARGDAWGKFKAEYYLYGILFLIFDVEALFLLPFAVAFSELPFGAFLAILFFIFLLVEGLAWAWMKGVLNWR